MIWGWENDSDTRLACDVSRRWQTLPRYLPENIGL